MKSRLRLYSHILQLRTEAYVALKYAQGGIGYAVAVFLVATLIAGSGIWLGLPAMMQRPLLSEHIERARTLVTRFEREVGQVLPQSLEHASRESLSQVQVDVWQEVLSEIAGMLTSAPLGGDAVAEKVLAVAMDADRLARLTVLLGLTEDQIAGLQSAIEESTLALVDLLDRLQNTIEQYQPPLGVRFSRAVLMLGNWISTPFDIMAMWAPFGFVLLVAIKMLGGKGTLRQHLTGLFVSGAPLFLLFLAYVPDLTSAMSIGYTLAFNTAGRLLLVVAVAWAILILLKSMSVTHEIGMWRVAGSAAMAFLVIAVLIPAVSLWIAVYVVAG